jgi:hypothetical protein
MEGTSLRQAEPVICSHNDACAKPTASRVTEEQPKSADGPDPQGGRGLPLAIEKVAEEGSEDDAEEIGFPKSRRDGVGFVEVAAWRLEHGGAVEGHKAEPQ